MNRNRVELLAPAGNFEGFIGALNAGADAIYLSGNKFGARAYAENFNNDELICAIETAHLFNRKVYLTLNTLIKQKELDSIYEFLLPLYNAKLDGVIVQDLGVIYYIHNNFPNLEIHLSTQLSVTGPYTPMLLKDYGVTRIVPARELNLNEIINIKKQCDIQIECFIHGAMCYSYSGMCLFSSIVGGRSGNRGRCAQPCRLPYSVTGQKDFYPLSMKDMCTINILDKLIDAGIDSFKIEGRMKKPEYSAFVTSIYRKYIDLYYKGQYTQISSEDMMNLSNMYIRADLSDGYYNKHNGREMVTINKPSYNGSDDIILNDIRNKYIINNPKLPITIDINITENDRLIYVKASYKDIHIENTSNEVLQAINSPITEENIIKQFSKTGDTYFEIKTINVCINGKPFIPVKSINELRRQTLELLRKKIIECNLISMYQ